MSEAQQYEKKVDKYSHFPSNTPSPVLPYSRTPLLPVHRYQTGSITFLLPTE